MIEKIKNLFRPKRHMDKSVHFQRVTTDEDFFSGGVFGTILAPDEDNDWKLETFEDQNICDKSASEIIDMAADSIPDMNRALYDTRQNVVTEWTWKTEEEDKAGDLILEDAIETIEELGSSIELKLGEMVDALFLKGALFCENIFEGDEFVDIAVMDPFRARYRKMRNPRRGEYWQLGQRQDGRFIPIESPRVKYLPLIPRAGKPYGRPMAGAAIFPMVYLYGILKAARQSMYLQAFPNRLITIDRKYLYDAGYDVDQIDEILSGLKSALPTTMANAGTGTQFIEGREVQIEMVGGVTRVSYDGLEMMERMLERQIIRGLKQYPINFGISEGSSLSSGNADQQIQQSAISIDSLQRQPERIFSIFGTQILNNAGNASTAVFQLKRNHASVEKIRAEQMKDKVALLDMAIKGRMITELEGRNVLKQPDGLQRLAEILKDDNEFQRMLEETAIEPESESDNPEPEGDDDE